MERTIALECEPKYTTAKAKRVDNEEIRAKINGTPKGAT